MPESTHNIVSPILAQFGIVDSVSVDQSSLQIENLKNAGGFSGANIWRINRAGEMFCLRCWPTGTDVERVAWIHAHLFAAADRGFGLLALPRHSTSTDSGSERKSFIESRNRIFEVSPWLPGVADFESSVGADRDAKLASAMTALAAFHNATDLADRDPQRSGSGSPRSRSPQLSPGLQMRAARCRRLLQGGLVETKVAMERYCSSASSQHETTFAETLPQLVREFERLAPDALPRLQHAATQPTTLQPCLRDIWHDHVLFTGKHVSGIVDYDAMQNETPAGDIARLLGSLVGNCRDSWRRGLQAYELQRSLTNADRDLVEAFDLGNALLSGLQWVSWICVEGKHFPDVPAVLRRMHHWSSRIQERSATVRLCP